MTAHLLDAVELYYIKDIHSRRHSGVRWSAEVRERMRTAAFLDRMQIIVLCLLVKRRIRK